MEKIQDILNEMIEIIKAQKEKNAQGENVSSFSFHGSLDMAKIHNNTASSIKIFGEDIKKFDDLYMKVYERLQLAKKKVSFLQFKQDTSDFFFFNPSELDFQNFVNEKYGNTIEYYYIAPIYGIVCNEDILDLGNIVFVSRKHLKDYLDSITNPVKDDLMFRHFYSEDEDGCLMFFVKKYKCYDEHFAKEKFWIDLDEIVNILRFFALSKTDRMYIGKTKNNPNKILFSAISKEKILSEQSLINTNDIAIKIDSTWLKNRVFYKTINIFCNDNKSDLENRIIRSLVWCVRSIEEYYLDLSCAEIAFAFESIFKSDKNRLITQSIQDQIAESAALILHDKYDDIIKQIKELKEFYGLRSAIAHGGKQEGNIHIYNSNLDVFRKVIIKLMEDDAYQNCNSLEDLKDILDKRKYS